MSKFNAITLPAAAASTYLLALPEDTRSQIEAVLDSFPVNPYDNRSEAKTKTDNYLMLSTDSSGVTTLSWSNPDGSSVRTLVQCGEGSAYAHALLLSLMTKGWGMNKFENRHLKTDSSGNKTPAAMNLRAAPDFEQAMNYAFGDTVRVTDDGYLAKVDGNNAWVLNPDSCLEYSEKETFSISKLPAHIAEQVKAHMAEAVKKFDLTVAHGVRFDGKAKVSGNPDEEVVELILGDYTVVISTDKGSCEVSYKPGAKFKKGGLPAEFQDPMTSAAGVLFRALGIKEDPKLFGENPPRVLTPEEQMEEDLKAEMRAQLAQWNRF